MTDRACAFCGGSLPADARSFARYCGKACRDAAGYAAKRERRRAKAAERQQRPRLPRPRKPRPKPGDPHPDGIVCSRPGCDHVCSIIAVREQPDSPFCSRLCAIWGNDKAWELCNASIWSEVAA